MVLTTPENFDQHEQTDENLSSSFYKMYSLLYADGETNAARATRLTLKSGCWWGSSVM